MTPRYRRWWPAAALVLPIAQLAFLLDGARLHIGIERWPAVGFASVVVLTPLTVLSVLALLATWGDTAWGRPLALLLALVAITWNATAIWLLGQVGTNVVDWVTAWAPHVALAGLAASVAMTFRLCVALPGAPGTLGLSKRYRAALDREHTPPSWRSRIRRVVVRTVVWFVRPATAWVIAGLVLLLAALATAGVVRLFLVIAGSALVALSPLAFRFQTSIRTWSGRRALAFMGFSKRFLRRLGVTIVVLIVCAAAIIVTAPGSDAWLIPLVSLFIGVFSLIMVPLLLIVVAGALELAARVANSTIANRRSSRRGDHKPVRGPSARWRTAGAAIWTRSPITAWFAGSCIAAVTWLTFAIPGAWKLLALALLLWIMAAAAVVLGFLWRQAVQSGGDVARGLRRCGWLAAGCLVAGVVAGVVLQSLSVFSFAAIGLTVVFMTIVLFGGGPLAIAPLLWIRAPLPAVNQRKLRLGFAASVVALLIGLVGASAFATGLTGPVGSWTRLPPVEEATAADAVQLLVQLPNRADRPGAVVSPDGKLVAATTLLTLGVWDRSSGLLLRRLPLTDIGPQLAWHPDSRHIASTSWTGIEIRDVRTGGVIQRFAPSGVLRAPAVSAFSADGKTIYTGHVHGGVFAWDVASGQMTRDFGIPGLPFSDGARIDVARAGSRLMLVQGERVRLFDSTGAQRDYRQDCSVSCSAKLTADGARLVLSSTLRSGDEREEIVVRDLTSDRDVAHFRCGSWSLAGNAVALERCDGGKRMRWTPPAGLAVDSAPPSPGSSPATADAGERMALSKSGRYLAFLAGAWQVSVWDLDEGREVRRLAAGREGFSDLIFEADTLFTVERSGIVRAWSAADTAPRTLDTLRAGQAFFFGGSRRMVLIARSPRPGIWAAARQTGAYSRVNSYGLDSEDDVILPMTNSDDFLQLPADRSSRSRFLRWDGGAYSDASGAFDISPDAQRLVMRVSAKSEMIGFSQSAIALRHRGSATPRIIEAGRPTQVSGIATRAAFLPNGDILAMTGDGHVRLRTPEGDSLIATWKPHSRAIVAVRFSPDGDKMFTASADGSVAVSSISQRRVLARLMAFSDSTWAVVDDQGRFDAANGGDITAMHWVVGMEPIQLDQLRERYYDPGLLAKQLGRQREPLRFVAAFDRVALFPEIHVDAPASDSSRFSIALRNRGGGIGRVTLHVNGRESLTDARPQDANANADSLHIEVDLARLPFALADRDNLVEIRAFDEAGHLSTRPVSIVRRAASARGFGVAQASSANTAPPRFWALVVGVSDYEGSVLDLRFAAKDAAQLGESLRLGARGLFGADGVDVTVLSTESLEIARRPTKPAIRAALQRIAARAKPEDVVVVYLSGHGTVHGGAEGQYYYLASEARSGDLTDPAVRARVAISATELGDLMRAVPGMKQVLILDTCGSGRASAGLTAQRTVPSSQVRSVQRMKDRVGMFVLAGSAADAVAYEASRYGQGVLTYTLLLGMRGAALRDEEFIDVNRLFSFAVDQVPQLAAAIGGIQRPELAVPRSGASFDVGRLTNADRGTIKLSAPSPVILRSNFQDETRVADHLGLGAAMNERFREAAARVNATIVFADASAMPDAFSIAGRYRVDGDTLRLTTRIFRGAEQIALLADSGALSDLESLTRRIAGRVERAVAAPRSVSVGR